MMKEHFKEKDVQNQSSTMQQLLTVLLVHYWIIIVNFTSIVKFPINNNN